MTDAQLSTLLSAIHEGKEFADALAAAGMTRDDYDNAVDEDPEVDDVVNQQIEEARMGGVLEPEPPPEPKRAAPLPIEDKRPKPEKPDKSVKPEKPARKPRKKKESLAPALRAPPPQTPPAPPPALAPPVAVLPEDDEEPAQPPDWCPIDKAQVTSEAAELALGLFGFLLWADKRLQDWGLPAMSPWWVHTLKLFYACAKMCGVFRVGRGGGKSTTLTRLAAIEALFSVRAVPPGQRWIWPFISVSTDDAARRVSEIAIVLRALGVRAEIKRVNGHPTIDFRDINQQSIGFISLAATIASVSGPTSIGGTIDEEAKLRDKVRNVNPSSEIITSLLQTFRARAGLHLIRCSSAWTNEGSHAQSITEGDTDENFIARIGEPFISQAKLGLLEVECYERAQGRDENARAIERYRSELQADSPNIPTWIANPTIGALASWRMVRAVPERNLGGVTQLEYWMRENVSVPLSTKGPSVSVDHMRGINDMNKRLSESARTSGGLIQFDGLSAEDPRARRGFGGDDRSL